MMIFEDRIDDVQYSPPDGSLLAVATSNFKSSLWDGSVLILQKQSQGAVLRRKYYTRCGNTNIKFLGWSCDVIISGGDDSSIRLWSLALKKEKPLQIIQEHHSIVSTLSVNPLDPTEFLSGSWDGQCKVWPANSRQSSVTLKGHSQLVWAVQWRDQGLVGSASQDSSFRLWDPRTGSSTSVHWEGLPVRSIAFLEENIYISTIAGVKQYDVRQMRDPIGVLPRRYVTKLVVGKNRLAVGGDDGRVGVLSSSLSVLEECTSHCDYARAVAWCPLEGSNELVSGGWDSSLAFHSLSSS